jgi:hypothetical protein
VRPNAIVEALMPAIGATLFVLALGLLALALGATG